MINTVTLLGRITHDLEIKSTQSGTAVLSFTVAVERSFAKQGEERQADFINCVAWKQTAEFIGKYFGKGRMIAITGELRTRTYDDKNGVKHYVTEVYVNQASFTGEAKQDAQNGSYNGGNSYGGNYSNNRPNTAQQGAQGGSGASIGNLSDFEDVLSDDGVPF